MQSKFFHRSLSRLSACFVALAILGTSLVQAAEFKPFVTVQLAGPSTLISIAEKVGPLVGAPAEELAAMAPYKNLPGVNPAGNIGLAIFASDAPFGFDVIVSLPISDFATFNIPGFTIPGLEIDIAALRTIATRQGNKYTFVIPLVGTFVAHQKQGYLLIATEDADAFAATADHRNIFAEVDEFTLGLHVNLDNISEEQFAKIWGPIAMTLAMRGMDVPDPEDLLEVFGPAAEQLADIASATLGLTLDPQTLNLSGTAQFVPKTGTAMANIYALNRDALAKSKLGAFLLDTPKTVLSGHYLNYFVDSEIEMLSDMIGDMIREMLEGVWEEAADGLLEGLYEALDNDEDNEQLAQFIEAVEAFFEYSEDILDFFAQEKLLDVAFNLDSDGTFLLALGTSNTAEAVALDEAFFGTLMDIYEEEGIKAFIEDKMKRDYDAVAGYSISCIPNIFSDLPADFDLPEELEELMASIPLSIFWAVKEGEALVYAAGLDFAKAEQTLKAALTRTRTQAPAKMGGTFALKPFAELVMDTWLPLAPEEVEADIEMVREMLAPLLNASANAKVVYEAEYPGAAYAQKLDVSGELLTVFFELSPAVSAAQGASRRMQCTNHIGIIVLALHNYHDTHNALPPLYTVDADGKPLHSWRVLILPYIEQGALYQQIRLNEPWDSPHNRQFHNVVIPIYSCPDNPMAMSGKSCTYSVIAGQVLAPATGANRQVGNSFAVITDGTSNTLAIVEVKEPFNWMDPTADITLDELAKGINKTGRVGSFHVGGINVGLFDGSRRFVSDTVPSELLRVLGNPRSGRPVTLP